MTTVMLIPQSLDTQWYERAAECANETVILSGGRVAFVEPDVELGEAPDEIQTSADSSTPTADAAPKEDGIYLAETPDETAKAEESFIAPEEPEIAEEAISEETVSEEAVSEEEAVAKEEVSKDEADSEEAEKTRDEDALEDSKEEKTE